MGWGAHLHEIPTSIAWALYALNFSWSLLLPLTGVLVLHVAARAGRRGIRAALRVHGRALLVDPWIYTWLNLLPMPKSLRLCSSAWHSSRS
jgi:hypothetical protein